MMGGDETVAGEVLEPLMSATTIAPVAAMMAETTPTLFQGMPFVDAVRFWRARSGGGWSAIGIVLRIVG